MEFLNKAEWNKFILENRGSFLQSWEWGKFQENFGRRVFRFNDADWQTQFIEYGLPLGKKYWYAPRGPIMSRVIRGQEFRDKIQNIIDEVKKISNQDIIFFRLGPEWEIRQGIEKILDKVGFKQLSYDIEPSQTLILDISKSEEELLAEMHEKWRYNIRLAERKGVQIKFVTSDITNFERYFEEFYRLVSKGTAARHQIKHHPKKYYRKQLEINPPQPSLKGGSDSDSPPKGGVRPFGSESLRLEEGDFRSSLFIAEYEDKVIAANIVVFFGNKATYLHGATDNEYRSLMAPHLLQWEQIKYAKQLGCVEYDFFGIANEHTLDKRGPSWEGFTHFKKGFGGREKNYIGYFDYPLDKNWYFLYRLAQKIRR